MNRVEAITKSLFETLLPEARIDYRDDQSTSVHDFDFTYPGRQPEAAEVTSSADQRVLSTHAAIFRPRSGSSAIKSHHCKSGWHISPFPTASINRIREHADEYLAEIEKAGIRRFFSLTDWDEPGVGRALRDLAIQCGAVIRREGTGQIWISDPISGGPVHPSLAIQAAYKEAQKVDNRRKLAVSGAEERHLIVYIDLSNYTPWCSMVDFEPPVERASLVPEITDLWLFTQTRTENAYAVWHASQASPWRNIGPIAVNVVAPLSPT